MIPVSSKHTATCLLAALLTFAATLIAGCTLPMKGKLRTDVNFAPPTGDSVIAIKPTDTYDKTILTRDELKPLLEAVAKIDAISGCWAVTLEETFHDNDTGETTKTIYHLDQSKPPAEMIELMLVDNKPPTEEQKQSAAKRMVKSYEKFLKQQEKAASAVKPGKSKQEEDSWMHNLKYRLADGSCHMEANGNILKYTIITGKRDNYKFGDGNRCEFLVDMTTTTLTAFNDINLVGTKMYGAVSLNLEIDEVYMTFAVIPGFEASMPSSEKTVRKVSGRLMGVGRKINGTRTVVYRDPKKVTCFDDRFKVNLGEISVVGED